jgi:hypothetical protein
LAVGKQQDSLEQQGCFTVAEHASAQTPQKSGQQIGQQSPSGQQSSSVQQSGQQSSKPQHDSKATLGGVWGLARTAEKPNVNAAAAINPRIEAAHVNDLLDIELSPN